MRTLLLMSSSLMFVAACSSDLPANDSIASTGEKPELVVTASPGKPTAPIRIGYELLSEPKAGTPLEIAVKFHSDVPGPVNVSFRGRDDLVLGANQQADMTFPAATASFEETAPAKVTVIPQSEGRSYLVVSATVAVGSGPRTKIMAIPVQVGSLPPRMERNGVLSGEGEDAVISMPAKETTGK